MDRIALLPPTYLDTAGGSAYYRAMRTGSSQALATLTQWRNTGLVHEPRDGRALSVCTQLAVMSPTRWWPQGLGSHVELTRLTGTEFVMRVEIRIQDVVGRARPVCIIASSGGHGTQHDQVAVGTPVPLDTATRRRAGRPGAARSSPVQARRRLPRGASGRPRAKCPGRSRVLASNAECEARTGSG